MKGWFGKSNWKKNWLPPAPPPTPLLLFFDLFFKGQIQMQGSTFVLRICFAWEIPKWEIRKHKAGKSATQWVWGSSLVCWRSPDFSEWPQIFSNVAADQSPLHQPWLKLGAFLSSRVFLLLWSGGCLFRRPQRRGTAGRGHGHHL